MQNDQGNDLCINAIKGTLLRDDLPNSLADHIAYEP